MKAIIHLSTANFFKIVLVLCISAAGAACNHNGPKPGPAPKAPEPGEPQPAPPPPPVPPQYTRPGSAGTAVPARRVMVQTDYGTQFALPDTLTCTDKYGLRTEAELEPVNCTTPPYSTLFDEAEFALRNRLSQVSCPDACPDKAVQITRLQGECAAQRNKAWVIVTTQLSCQAANAPALPTLQLPDPLPARFDNRLPGVTAPSPLCESCATHVEIHYDANGEEIAELCPTSWVVAGTSKARVTSCDAACQVALAVW